MKRKTVFHSRRSPSPPRFAGRLRRLRLRLRRRRGPDQDHVDRLLRDARSSPPPRSRRRCGRRSPTSTRTAASTDARSSSRSATTSSTPTRRPPARSARCRTAWSPWSGAPPRSPRSSCRSWRPRKIPLVAGSASSGAVELQSEVSFPVNAGAPGMSIGTGRLAAEAGPSTVVIASDNEGSQTGADLSIQGAESAGAKMTKITMKLGAPDVSASVARALQMKPDAIALQIVTEDALKVVKSLRQSGYKGALTAPGSLFPPASIEALGEFAEAVRDDQPGRAAHVHGHPPGQGVPRPDGRRGPRGPDRRPRPQRLDRHVPAGRGAEGPRDHRRRLRDLGLRCHREADRTRHRPGLHQHARDTGLQELPPGSAVRHGRQRRQGRRDRP
ncbi:hypothetical protein SHIRM173S_09152 [Streptomyces hirsutus]